MSGAELLGTKCTCPQKRDLSGKDIAPRDAWPEVVKALCSSPMECICSIELGVHHLFNPVALVKIVHGTPKPMGLESFADLNLLRTSIDINTPISAKRINKDKDNEKRSVSFFGGVGGKEACVRDGVAVPHPGVGVQPFERPSVEERRGGGEERRGEERRGVAGSGVLF